MVADEATASLPTDAARSRAAKPEITPHLPDIPTNPPVVPGSDKPPGRRWIPLALFLLLRSRVAGPSGHEMERDMPPNSTISRPPTTTSGEPPESPLVALTPSFEAEPKPAALENDLLILLHDVARQMSTYADAKAQTLGVTRAQLILLARLERQPDASQSELADVAEVTPPTIARLVDRLEELGLVQRFIDPKDRRVWRLRLTPAASPILREMERLQPKLHSAVTKGIDPSVLEAMALGLNRMKENVSGRRLTEANS
jgi:MarR family transcriptional regulator for hemolysin